MTDQADPGVEIDNRHHVTIVKGEHEGQEDAWIVVNPSTVQQYAVFGLPQGGVTREEALFWAERICSKNDLILDLPPGWDDVVATLPEDG